MRFLPQTQVLVNLVLTLMSVRLQGMIEGLIESEPADDPEFVEQTTETFVGFVMPHGFRRKICPYILNCHRNAPWLSPE